MYVAELVCSCLSTELGCTAKVHSTTSLSVLAVGNAPVTGHVGLSKDGDMVTGWFQSLFPTALKFCVVMLQRLICMSGSLITPSLQ